MRQARKELSSWLLEEQRGEEPDDWEVGIFFELMGALTRNHVLGRRMVWHAFGVWIVAYFEFMTKPTNLIDRWRKDSNDPLIFAEFEWLANQMLDIDRRLSPGPGYHRWAVTDSKSVLEAEAHLRVPSESMDGRP